VEGKLRQASYLLLNWSRREEVEKKINIIVYPVESSHDMKNNSQWMYIPIQNGSDVVGNLEIARSELSSEYVNGLEHSFIILEGVEE